MSKSFVTDASAASPKTILASTPFPPPPDKDLPEDERQPRMAALEEGERVGRFVAFRDQDGHLHAVAAGAVGAMCETDDGTLLMLPGGRMLHVPRAMCTVLAWLDGRGPLAGSP